MTYPLDMPDVTWNAKDSSSVIATVLYTTSRKRDWR